MIRLMVFLGNKGIEYERTRHNSAWLFFHHISPELGPISWQEKFHGTWGKASFASQQMMVLKPSTYMNESGKSVGAMSRFFSLDPKQILVVHDDLELPFLVTRLQLGGGLGGHNGLRSIKEHVGSTDFYRLRIGIGRPVRQTVSSYVLSRFSVEEEPSLSLAFDAAKRLLGDWMGEGCPDRSLPRSITVGQNR